MTPEQKAEAYDKALKRAKEALNDGGISFNAITYLQNIFPEIKDEMIKKKLLSLIEWSKSFNNASGITDDEAKEMAAWIEKQGEQKSFDYENANIQQKDFAPIEPDDLIEECYQHQAEDIIDMVTEKPSWSEEDEIILNDIFDILSSYYSSTDDVVLCDNINKTEDWLNTLKQRIGG